MSAMWSHVCMHVVVVVLGFFSISTLNLEQSSLILCFFTRSLFTLTTIHVNWRAGGEVFTSAHAPVPPCVCVFGFFCFVWFDFLRDWAMLGLSGALETHCCNWQFILHTHPQTDCSQVYRHTYRDTENTHPQTDGSHTPTTEFSLSRARLCLAQTDFRTCIHVVTADTRQVSLWQAGLASITNWRVLSKKKKIITSLCQSVLQKWVRFSFPPTSSLYFLYFPSESNWSPPCRASLSCESNADWHS